MTPSSFPKYEISNKPRAVHYHIENEYVMQLNPRDFDAVPEFVIAACTELVAQVAPA